MRWWGVVPIEHLHRQHGPLGRTPACVWVIAVAIYGDKQMDTLATLSKANMEVCFVQQQLFQNVLVTSSGDVPTVFRPFCLNADWNNLFQTI